MRKRLNFKALLILAVAGAAVATTVHYVHAAQVRRHARGLLEEAKRLEQDGEIRSAADCFGQYLVLAPGDGEAKASFGLLIIKLAKTPRERLAAYLALWDALRADPRRDDVRRQLAVLALDFARFTEAREHLEFILAREPENPQLLVLRARCALRENEESQAASWYAKAVKAAPQDIETAVEYATLQRDRLYTPIFGADIVEQMLRATGRKPEARIAAARYFRRSGLLDKAEQALEPEPNEGGVRKADELFLSAQVARDRDKREDAHKWALQGWRQFPEDGRFPRELAQLEFDADRRDKAVEYLGYALAKLPEQPEQLLALGALLIDLDRKEDAAKVIVLLDKKLSIGGDHLRARLLMKQGAWAEAAQLLEKDRNDTRSGIEAVRFTILMLADCYEQLHNPDQQLLVLRQAVERDPSWGPGRRRLARAQAANGQTNLAIAALKLAANRSPEDKAVLVRLMLQSAARPASDKPDWSETERLVEELENASWDSAEVVMLRAQLLAAQGKFAEARESLRDRDPKQLAPWLFLFSIAEKQPKGKTGTEILAEAERQLGPRVEWSLARAQLWLKAAPEMRKNLPAPLLELDRFKGKDRDRLLAALCEVFSAAGERAIAQRLWAELAEKEPNNLRAWLAQLDDALEKKEWGLVERVLGQIRRLEGANGAHALCGAVALRIARADPADRSSLAGARTDLARAAASRPAWAKVYVLEAVICEREGNLIAALEKYKSALERGATQLPILRRVLELQFAQGLFGEAAELLRKLPEQDLSTPELGRLAAQVTLVNAGRDGANPSAGRREALERARKAVAADSTNYRDFAWLGQMAALAGEQKEAEKALRRACELNGKTLETWVPLVVFLARSDAGRAEAAIEEAKKRLPAEQLPLSLALFHEALGRTEPAGEQYRTALEARPNDVILLRHAAIFNLRTGQAATGASSLRKLIEIASAAKDANLAAWGRRQLALALALQGGFQEMREAQALLEQNGRLAGVTLEDRQIKAAVLATSSAHRREAIQLLESLGPPSNLVRLLLARLNETIGNWPAAEEQYQELLRNNAKSPVVLGRYVRGLVSQRQTRKAEVWLEKLVALAPASLDTLEVQVRVLKQTGHEDKAAELLLTYAKTKDARLDQAALGLEMLGRPADAERLFRDFADLSKQAERTLPLARFLGRQKRAAEGLAICEKAWESADPVAVAASCVAILRTGRGERNPQVELWIKTAMAKQPQEIRLPLFLAELHELNGLYDEAAAVYRQILQKERLNVFALNNLANLQALRGADLDEALTLIQQAISVGGNVPALLDTRAGIYRRLGKLDLALRDLEDAVGNAGANFPALYMRLAKTQNDAHDRTGAQLSYRKALDAGFKVEMLQPLEREEYRNLAKALE
jgi:cellulose synthase operon protein C